MSSLNEVAQQIRIAQAAAKSVGAAPVHSALSFVANLPRRFGYVSGLRRAPSPTADGIERIDAMPEPVRAVLAARADAVNRAEAAALELAARLLPWGATAPRAIEWIVVNGALPDVNDFGSAFSSAEWSVEAAVEAAGDAVALGDEFADLPRFCRACLAAAENWRRAVARDLEVPGNHWPREAVKWKKFSTLLDPTAAALDVWRTGYVLSAGFSDADPVLRFFASAYMGLGPADTV